MTSSGPHAVRWAQRKIQSRFTIQYSKWHWTLDASTTLCGRMITLISDGIGMLPEARDEMDRVTCSRCLKILRESGEIPHPLKESS